MQAGKEKQSSVKYLARPYLRCASAGFTTTIRSAHWKSKRLPRDVWSSSEPIEKRTASVIYYTISGGAGPKNSCACESTSSSHPRTTASYASPTASSGLFTEEERTRGPRCRGTVIVLFLSLVNHSVYPMCKTLVRLYRGRLTISRK